MTANNYRFKKINFPDIPPTGFTFVDQKVITNFSIPDGATNLDLETIDVTLNSSGRIYASFNASVHTLKDGGLSPPIYCEYALLYNLTQFPGSDRELEWGDSIDDRSVIITASMSPVLVAGNYTVRIRVLSAVVDAAGILDITPSGCFTVFKIES